MPSNSNERRFKRMVIQLLVQKHGDSCCRCGLAVDVSLSGNDMQGPTLDHLIPIAAGGAESDVDNLRVAHRRCNLKHSDGVRRGPRMTSSRPGPGQLSM